MYRGTTPTLTFTFPFDLAGVECMYITFAQRGEVKLEKCFDDCAVSEDAMTATVCLTQADTLALDCSCGALDIQIRLKRNDGTTLASKIIKTTVGRILKDGEI